MDQLTNKVFNSIGSEDVDMITFTKEKRILSVVVDGDKLIDTARAIHKGLF